MNDNINNMCSWLLQKLKGFELLWHFDTTIEWDAKGRNYMAFLRG